MPLLLVSPFLAQYAPTTPSSTSAEPTRQVAEAATKVWHAAFGRPLRYVAGTQPLATAATFYSSDAPSLVLFDDPSASPWASPAQVAEDGLLIICRAIDAKCIAKAASSAGPDALHYWDRFESTGRGGAITPHTFSFTLLPPANAKAVWD